MTEQPNQHQSQGHADKGRLPRKAAVADPGYHHDALEKTGDKLDELQLREVALPPEVLSVHLHSDEEVVGVHDGMDEEVDDGRPSGVGLAEVGEHGYENGQVMVPDVDR